MIPEGALPPPGPVVGDRGRVLAATAGANPAPDRRRILFAIPALDRGGPDRVFFDLIRGLDRSRFQPLLATLRDRGHYLSLLPPDVEVHVLGSKRPGRRPGRYPILALAAAVRQTRPDLVLATLMSLTALPAKPLFPRGIPLVVRQANQFSQHFDELVARAPIKHRISRFLSTLSYRWADVVVCQSDAMRDDLRGQLRRPPEMVVIGNPIDIDWVRARAASEDVAVAGRPSLVGVGRLAHQKGYDILLRAFASVLREHPRAHLTLLGDGPEREQLERLAQTLGVAAAVTFAGFTPNPYPAMRKADLFVSASRYEGFANVILESLACGTPVVATECPGAAREVVEEGRTGWLVAPDSAPALAAGIRRGLREGPGLDPRDLEAFCRARFSPRRIIGQYEELLLSVIRASKMNQLGSTAPLASS